MLLSPLPHWDIHIVGQYLADGWGLDSNASQNTIDEKESSISGKNMNKSAVLDVDCDEMKKHRSKSFLRKILKHHHTSKTAAEDVISNCDKLSGNLITLLFSAGLDTSSITMIMCLMIMYVPLRYCCQ